VLAMGSMFSGATKFNQSLANWKLGAMGAAGGPAYSMDNMFNNSGLSSATYGAMLSSWAGQSSLKVAYVGLGAAGIKYPAAAATARSYLINHDGWIISDAGQA